MSDKYTKRQTESSFSNIVAWCNRWVVLHKISDLSAGKLLAKLDIYLNAEQACLPDTKLSTILLENITSICPTPKSKTHPYAFEIRDKELTILSFLAATLSETQLWVCVLREIFCPQPLDDAGSYEVWIRENETSARLSLSEDYFMTITPSSVSINKLHGQGSFEWPLTAIKRFYVRPLAPESQNNNILIIESGPNSDTGEGKLMFVSPRAEQILASIRTNIFIAVKQKNTSTDTVQGRDSTKPNYDRTISLPQHLNSDRISKSPKNLRHVASYGCDRPFSTIGMTANEFMQHKTQDFSISLGPPKPARSYVYIPNSPIFSETISCPDKCSDNSESFDRECVLRHSDSQIKTYTTEQVLHTQRNCPAEDTNLDQVKTRTELKDSSSSRDSGILSICETRRDDSESMFDFRKQTSRSDSTDSAVSLHDRQRAQTQIKLSQNSPILERSLKPSDIQSNGNIYWDIDNDVPLEYSTDIKMKSFTIPPKGHSVYNPSCMGSNDKQIEKTENGSHEYEEVVSVKRNWIKKKIVPPALPERPKTLRLISQQLYPQTSPEIMERIHNTLTPKTRRKVHKERKESDNLNKIIEDFRKFSEKNKIRQLKKEMSTDIRKFVRSGSDIILDYRRELEVSKVRDNRIHSSSTSDASKLFWKEEETKEGVFLVEQNVNVNRFLKKDPFGLMSENQISKQTNVSASDKSPVLTPTENTSKSVRCPSTDHWSDNDSRTSDSDSDQELTYRRRTMSLGSKIGRQAILKKVYKLHVKTLLNAADKALLPETDPENDPQKYIDMSGRFRSYSYDNEILDFHKRKAENRQINSFVS